METGEIEVNVNSICNYKKVLQMNGNEFLKTLSKNAINVMESFQYIESQKPCEVVIINDKYNPAYINPLEDKNIIAINPSVLKNNSEYVFLHEYIHCKQIDLCFPRVMPYSSSEDSVELCTAINSFVLDLHVNNYLRKFNLHYNENIPFIQFKTILKLESENGFQNYSLNGIIYFAEKIAMYKTNNLDVNEMLKYADLINKKIRKTYQLFIKGYKLYDCNTKQSIYKMFKYLVSNLAISDIVEIS